MPICTYLSYDEANDAIITLNHKKINELISEINTYPGERWVVKSTVFTTGYLWWKKEVTVYTLYSQIMDNEYQLINFYRENTDWSINTHNSADIVVAYLYGRIGALNQFLGNRTNEN